MSAQPIQANLKDIFHIASPQNWPQAWSKQARRAGVTCTSENICSIILPRHTTLLPRAVRRDRELTTAADGLENNQCSAFFMLLINNEDLEDNMMEKPIA